VRATTSTPQVPESASPLLRSRRALRGRGFTLLELIVVLVVLGLLAAVAIPTYQRIISASGFAAQQERDKALANRVAAGIKLEPERATSDVDPANGVVDVFDDAFSETSGGAYSPGLSAVTVNGWSLVVDNGPVYTEQATGSGIVVGSGIFDGVTYLMTVSKYGDNVALRCRISIDNSLSQCWVTENATDFTLTTSVGGPAEEEYIAPTRQAMLLVSGPSGALDDALVTNGSGTTYVSDDFNRADGPIGGLWSLFEAYAPGPNISGNQLVTSDGSLNFAFFEAPDATYEISAKVTSVPSGPDSVAVQATVLSGGYAEGLFSVEAGRGMMLVSDPADPFTYISAAPSVTVNAGDVIKIRRNNSNQLRYYFNGVEQVSFSRNWIGSITGTITGVVDPTQCIVTSYFNGVTEATRGDQNIANATPDESGNFTVRGIATMNPKVSFTCDGGQYGVYGTATDDVANGSPVTVISGGTVAIGSFG
jgi:prepilin-type N-terminal cleavage/methylation domain-containing protein